MASSIVTTSIDATYPVAGQDNDSQGFRDNFSQIKTQLGTAATEITSLQTNRATTNATTDFNGHDVKRANLQDWGQKIVAKGSVSGSVACDFEDGNVTTLTTGGDVTLTFTNFPKEDDGSTNTFASMKVLLTKGTSTNSVTLKINQASRMNNANFYNQLLAINNTLQLEMETRKINKQKDSDDDSQFNDLINVK